MNRPAFDPDAIRELVAILQESGLTEIEITDKDSRIRVVRAPAPVSPVPLAQTPLLNTIVPPPAAVPPEDDSRHPGAVLSPMVGIAYLAPEPGAAPFVQPGQLVAAGQTLILIEAMKTFNQIKSPRAGTVGRILVASGAPVEFGEVLLILDP